MDEDYSESVDTSSDVDMSSDIDVSSDVDTSDVVDDAPADFPEDIPEDVPEDVPDDAPEDALVDFPEDIPEDVPEDIPADVTEDSAEDIPEDVPEDVPDDAPEDAPVDFPEDIPEDVPEDIPADATEDSAEDIPEDVPEDVHEEVPEEAPEDATEDFPDDSSEDVAEDAIEDISENNSKDNTEESEDSIDEMTDETSEDMSEGVLEDTLENTSDEETSEVADESIPEGNSDLSENDNSEESEFEKDNAEIQDVDSDSDADESTKMTNMDSSEITDQTQDNAERKEEVADVADESADVTDNDEIENSISDTQRDEHNDRDTSDYETAPETLDNANPETIGETAPSDNPYQEEWEKFGEEYSNDKDDANKWDSLVDVPFAEDEPSEITDGLEENHDESLFSRVFGANDKQDVPNEVIDDNQDYSDQISRIQDLVGEDEYKEHQGFYDNLAKLDVSPEYRDKLTDCYKGMDSDLKDVYNDYSDKLNCLDTKYDGTAHYSPEDGGFYFNEQKDIAKGLGEGNTFFHESAHMIDDISGNASYANNMTDAIQADYDDAISSIMSNENCTIEQAQEKLSNELWNNPNESNCVSDVFGGLTGNKVSGPWGHRAEYWANRDRSVIGMEAFAEITADSACNANNLAFTQKYMPRTYSTYKNIIGSIKGGKTI